MSDAQHFAESGALSGRALAVSLLRRLPRLLLAALTVSTLVLVVSLRTARRYRAEVSFSTLTSNRGGALAGALPAALLGAATSGLQPSPALLARLVRSQNVEVRVARMSLPNRSDRTVADVVELDASKRSSNSQVAAALRRLVSADIDRETGLVTIAMSHKDSALARFVVDQIVSEVTTVFQGAVMSQVSDTRRSLAQRLATANARLQKATRSSQEFATGNRQVAPYSVAAVEQDRLARELSLAQTLYNQVLTESETARDKEREAVPAVVVVDPVPRELPPEGRQTLLKTVVAFICTFLGLFGIAALADLIRQPSLSPAQQQKEFENAVRATPLLRRMLKN